jgi:hypothetical protein
MISAVAGPVSTSSGMMAIATAITAANPRVVLVVVLVLLRIGRLPDHVVRWREDRAGAPANEMPGRHQIDARRRWPSPH